MGEKQHYDHAFSRFLIKMKNIHSERMRRGWFKWLHWVRAIAHAFNDGGHGTSSAPTTQESICLLSMQSLHGNIVRLPIHTRRHVGHSGTRQTYSTSHWCECDAAVRAWRAPRMKNGPFPISKSISIYFFNFIASSFLCYRYIAYVHSIYNSTLFLPLSLFLFKFLIDKPQRNACFARYLEKWIFPLSSVLHRKPTRVNHHSVVSHTPGP